MRSHQRAMMGTMIDHLNGNADSISEAEVTLRLAFWFLDRTGEGSYADIAIDGAHVRIRVISTMG